ncbi:MAG: L-ribulose-5-phosphate 3-epimerase [Spirochaetaceae bacterium]|jgi:L-ribulose-5-phosphate 3-epimerase|nr:L-ribulose-5-phosphate 3-epimerase [Spirochaetaceae bacterium]
MTGYEIGLYEKALPISLSWEEKFAAVREFGYDWLEISIDETDRKLSRLDWPQERLQKLRKWMINSGVPIKTMCLSGHRKYPLGSENPATLERGLDIMKKAVDFAAELGLRIIQTAGYDEYYNESNAKTKAIFENSYVKSVEFAAKAGVTLAFETMETPFMNTVGKALDFIKKIDSPWLQIYPDMGNITNATVAEGKSPLDDLLSGKGHISAVHLKESKPGIFREVPFGEGHVDFEGLIKTSLDMGVRMFTTEFWYTEGQPTPWREWVGRHKTFIDKIFAKI